MKQGLLDIKFYFFFSYKTENKKIQGFELSKKLNKKLNCYQNFKKNEHLIIVNRVEREYKIPLKNNINLSSKNSIQLEFLDCLEDGLIFHFILKKGDEEILSLDMVNRNSFCKLFITSNNKQSILKSKLKIQNGDKFEIIMKQNEDLNINNDKILQEKINKLKEFLEQKRFIYNDIETEFFVKMRKLYEEEIKTMQNEINMYSVIQGKLFFYFNNQLFVSFAGTNFNFFDTYDFCLEIPERISVKIITERKSLTVKKKKNI